MEHSALVRFPKSRGAYFLFKISFLVPGFEPTTVRFFQAHGDPYSCRSTSQISLATSPDVLQTTPTPTMTSASTSTLTNQLLLHPPARPRKPPRLLHYANMTFQTTMNRSRSCSPEKPIRIIGGFIPLRPKTCLSLDIIRCFAIDELLENYEPLYTAQPLR